MRKLMFGLTAFFAVFFGTTASALAEAETSQDGEVIERPVNTVDCTMLNFTEPNVVNEDYSYDVGTPISLELSVPKGGELYPYFMIGDSVETASVLSEGSFTYTWTPDTAGQYWIFGEFTDLSEQSQIEVADRKPCSVTLTIVNATEPAYPDHPDEVAQPAAPTPTQPPVQPPAAPSPAVQDATAAPAVQTLPHTGIKDWLPLFGASLLFVGFMLTFGGRKLRLAKAK